MRGGVTTKTGEKPGEGDIVKPGEGACEKGQERVLNTGEYFPHDLATWRLL